MKLIDLALGVTVLAGLIAAGCSGGNQQNDASKQGMPSMPASAPPTAAAPPAMQGVDVTFKTQPDPLKVGENTFEAMVMAGGQPVTDASVSVEFVMPAMPSMNMAEMRSTASLKHQGNGRYHGTGNVAMAGGWDATVKVTRGGQAIGERKLRVTAK
jgi:hypothetical protein